MSSTGANPELEARKRTRGGRERLLHAAIDLFAAHGVGGTSLQMIADRLGVTKAALYHHFRTRDDIIEALMVPVVAEAEEALRRVRALPETERASSTRRFYVDFVVRHRRTISTVLFDRGSLRPGTSTTVGALIDSVAALWRAGDDAVSDAAARVSVLGLAAVASEPARAGLSDDQLRAELLAVVA